MRLQVRQLVVAERLHIADWNISQAQFIGVIGTNGAGKSTLLSAIAGLVPVAANVVHLNNRDLSQLSDQQRRQLIRYLPQFASVNAAVSVQQVLQQGLVNLHLTVSVAEAIEHVSREFDLAPLLSRPITQLSGGEQRRVQVARACLGEAELLVFDEPGSGLDIGHQLELMDHLKARSQAGQLVLAALHDLALAAQYCDQLLLLHQGRVVAFGPPNEVLTTEHLAETFAVTATWLCNDDGVALLAQRLRKS